MLSGNVATCSCVLFPMVHIIQIVYLAILLASVLVPRWHVSFSVLLPVWSTRETRRESSSLLRDSASVVDPGARILLTKSVPGLKSFPYKT